jgi:hypothetical protein
MSEHELTHAKFSDGRLTPACVCGWYSPNCEHADFERHLRKVKEEEASERNHLHPWGSAPALADVQRDLITAAARAVELGEHDQADVLRAAAQQIVGAYVQMGWATVMPVDSKGAGR